jgi:hypothetical protein
MEAMHLQGNESCLELENEQKMKEQPVLKKMSLPREHVEILKHRNRSAFFAH